MTTTDANKAAKQPFASLEDAKAVTPSAASFRIYEVVIPPTAGGTFYTWGESQYTAFHTVVTKALNGTAELAEGKARGPVDLVALMRKRHAEALELIPEESREAFLNKMVEIEEKDRAEKAAKKAEKEAAKAAAESNGVHESPAAEQPAEEPKAEEQPAEESTPTKPKKTRKNQQGGN